MTTLKRLNVGLKKELLNLSLIMKNTLKVVFVAVLISLVFHSCRKEGCTDSSAVNYDNKAKKDDDSCILAPKCENNYTYFEDIILIIEAHCLSCHQPGGTGYASTKLDSYSAVKTSAVSGKMLDAINHMPGTSPMPQGAPKLGEKTIKMIECWVANGAPEF
jgi:hypothetical protein